MGRFPLLRIVEAAAPRSPEFDYTALDTLLPHQPVRIEPVRGDP
jgi:hypothetical protein